MTYSALLRWTPLATATVWLIVVLYQVGRDRFRTWTEAFFVAASASFFAYGASDFFVLNASDPAVAKIFAVASLTSVLLSEMFWMLYGVVLYTRMRRGLFFAVVPTLVFVPLLPTKIIVGLTPLEASGPPYALEYDALWFLLFVAVLMTYALIAIWTLYRTYREVSRHSVRLAKRMRALLAALIAAAALGGLANIAPRFIDTPPVYSTFFAIPGILALFAVSPLSYDGLVGAVRRWKARGYDIRSAVLLYRDGTIIGSKIDPTEDLGDRDLFGATLEVIQSFMRTSIPGLRGKFLRSIIHGDYELVIERGKYVHLVTVVRGRGSDFLRVQMREGLRKFEAENRATLERWKGAATDARGTAALLDSFIGEPEADAYA